MSRRMFAIVLLPLWAWAVSASVASAWEWGRLDLTVLSTQQQIRGSMESLLGPSQSPRASLAARQDLYTEVCIAKSDGRVTNAECQRLLGDAKKVLKTDEYASFEQAMISMSPEYVQAHQPRKIFQKPKIVPKEEESQAEEVATVLSIHEASSQPMIPSGVIRPERIAFRTRVQ